ncbi:MAG: RNA-directed DNA polymerase, partial [Syntrophobacteraceae bacterium]|nr:RNA-directed DNA polymerase [Syntrophobacteraceae bacterium]
MARLTSDIAEIENLERAFRRVESARGMPGVDGVSLDAWRRDLQGHLQKLSRDLAEEAYRPLPLLGCLMAAPGGSP